MSNKKPMSSVVTTNSDASQYLLDPIVAIRSSPVAPPESIPAVPNGFKFLDASGKAVLKKMPDSQRAEVREALGEIGGKAGGLAEDLGRYAPDPQAAGTLLLRIEQIRTAKGRARALLDYLEEVEDVAHHDAMTLVGLVKREVLHTAQHDPTVTDRYPAVMALVEQTRDAIVEGRARAAAARNGNAPPPAPTSAADDGGSPV